jgi:acetyltransferase
VTAPTGALDALFAPRGVAVIGASRDPGKLGAVMARSLARFSGRVAQVNPHDLGMYQSVGAAAADGPVDLAVLCVPAAISAAALADAAAAGVGAAVVCGGGFAEAGPEGARHQAALTVVAAETGIRVLGPNTSGFLVPAQRLTASFVPGAAGVPAGRIAVVAASGGVNHAVAFLLAESGHGVSIAVGLGNSADITAPDVLDYLAADPNTAAIGLHVESVADGPRLVAAVSRLAAAKPVVALVVGRNDVAAFAQSHTGALATSWRTTRAALRQAGAVLVDSERELVDAVGALSLVRLPVGASGVGVLTGQAGPGLLLLDNLRGRAASVPDLTAETQARLATLLPPLTYQRNPVDTGRPGPEFAPALSAVAADPGIDVVAVYALHEPDALDLATAVKAAAPAIPVIAGVGGTGPDVTAARRALLEHGVPALADPTGAAAAIAALLADSAGRQQQSPATPSRPDVQIGSGPWDEAAAKDVLDALGIPTPPRRVCPDRDSAQRALAELGGPVAVKLLDAAVLHKTEIGGVRLGVCTAADMDAALDAIGADRVLVEAMALDGVDLVVGARRDPVFGPVLLVGLGGTVAEALADVAVRVAPVHPRQAAGMASELVGRALLDGWRGGPVLDRSALGRIIAGLGDLLLAHPHLQDVEINPLRVTAGGLVALDAVIIAGTEEPDGHADR